MPVRSTAAKALAAELPQGTSIIASTLQRCEQLVHVLCGLRPDLPCKFDARLVEMNFGQWEGQRWDAIAPAELQQWTDAFATWRCGGGECVADVMQRVGDVWDETQRADQPAIWITHAGVIRAAALIGRGQRTVERADQWPVEAPAFGQWLCVLSRAETELT